MRKVLKISAWIIGGVAVLVGAAALYAQFGAERRMNRIVAVTPSPVAILTDPAALARGKYLYDSRGCMDCHARDGAGRTFIDDGALVVRGPNLTAGKAGIATGYSDLDWVRAIRHGVGPQGKPLLIMPSEDYARLSDEDLGALIAYIRSLPPVDGEPRELRLPLPVRFAYAVGIIKDASEKIDHSYRPMPPKEDLIAQGAYVAAMCMGCHGEGFTGGKIPGGPPDWPAAANLTPVAGGAMLRYPDTASFAAMLRSGKRPDGTAIAVMPFESLSELNDDEVTAMYAYFRSLAPAGK
jgi:mono/diheme cytochrome c family protein